MPVNCNGDQSFILGEVHATGTELVDKRRPRNDLAFKRVGELLGKVCSCGVLGLLGVRFTCEFSPPAPLDSRQKRTTDPHLRTHTV